MFRSVDPALESAAETDQYKKAGPEIGEATVQIRPAPDRSDE